MISISSNDIGRIYTFHYGNKSTFLDAKDICSDGGGHLASINSVTAKTTIFEQLKKQTQQYWWIGLMKNDLGQWVWLNGEPMNNTIIYFRERESNPCGALFSPARNVNPLLYDYSCDNEKFCYICEHPLVYGMDDQPGTTASPTTKTNIIIPLLLLVVVTAILVAFVLRVQCTRRSGANNTKESAVPNNANTDRQPSTSAVQPTVDEDVGYATIDTIIYSEIVDNACDHGEGNDGKTSCRYAQVQKKSRRCDATTDKPPDNPPEYAQVMKKQDKNGHSKS